MSYKIAEFRRIVDESGRGCTADQRSGIDAAEAVLSLVRRSQNLRRAREFGTGAKVPHIEAEAQQS